jgi:hypothetical protein
VGVFHNHSGAAADLAPAPAPDSASETCAGTEKVFSERSGETGLYFASGEELALRFFGKGGVCDGARKG